MDDITAKKGGTTPSSFPHVCPLALNGADENMCGAYTTVFLRNQSTCCQSKCNAYTRKCYVCIEEGRGKNAGNVVDPNVGLCDEHSATAHAAPSIPAGVRLNTPVFAQSASRTSALRRLAQRFVEKREATATSSEAMRAPVHDETCTLLPAKQAQPIDNETVAEYPTKPGENIIEEESVPASTITQFELLHTLNGDEKFVLMQTAYGLDMTTIDVKLRLLGQRVGTEDAAELLREVYRKLDLSDMEKERDRRNAAGKIYLDAREHEIDTETVGMYTSVPSAPSNGSGESGSDAAYNGDADTVDGDTDDEETDVTETANREEKTMTDPAVRDALKVSAQWVAANTDESKERPNVRAVFDAVETMLASGMKAREVGLEFGNSEASGQAWVSIVKSFGKFNAAIWALIGDHPIAMSALKDASTKGSVPEQRVRIQNWIDKHSGKADTKTAKSPRAPKPARASSRVGAAREAPEPRTSRANGAKNGSTAVVVANGHDDAASGTGFSLAALSENPEPKDIFDFTVGVVQGVGELHRIANLLGSAVESAESLDLHEAAAAQVIGNQIDVAMADMQRLRDMFVRN